MSKFILFYLFKLLLVLVTHTHTQLEPYVNVKVTPTFINGDP